MPTFKEELLSLLSSLLTTSTKCFICGDFNYCANDEKDPEGRSLTAALEATGLRLHSKDATHELGHTLDWILSHNVDVSLLHSQPCAWSDHYFVFSYLPLKQLVAKRVFSRLILPKRNIRNISLDQWSNSLQPLIGNLMEITDTDLLASSLRDILNHSADRLAPVKLKLVKPETAGKTWFSDVIVAARTLKRRAEAKWRKQPSKENKTAYLMAAAEYKKSIIAAKSEHFNARIEGAQSDSRELFTIVKELESSAKSLETSAVSQEWCQSIQNALFEKIDKHVSKIEAKLASLSPDAVRRIAACSPGKPPNCPLFSFRPVSISEVRDTVMAMKPTSYKGDICTAELIQKSIELLAPILTHFVNISFASSVVPAVLKESWITPLLKKAGLDPQDPLNYRPITNVSFMLKILDKLAYIQIQEFLELHQLLNSRQSGFRRGFGTESALLDLKNCLAAIIDKGSPALLLLLDLSAAFDLVDHSLLVKRLVSNFAFSEEAASWVHSFLNERLARVSIGSMSATPTPLSRGVPQGSCLSPTLYNLYTCPLFDALEQEGVGFTNYADDTQLFLPLSGVYVQDHAQICKIFEFIQEWMAVNGLALNGDKTEIMVLGTRQKLLSLPACYSSFEIDNCVIKVAKVVKTLGVYLDANLTMHNHALKVKSSCAYVIKLLNQIKAYLSTKCMARVAGALVNSRIDYCNSLLAGTDNKVIQTLQIVQNNAVRAVTGLPRHVHISEARRSLHWLAVGQRIKHKICTLTHKCLHKSAPSYLSDSITLHDPGRSLRSSGTWRLSLPRCRLATFGGRTFASQAPLIWNSLPVNLKNAKSHQVFRKELKTFLFSGVT